MKTKLWNKPIYEFPNKNGGKLVIDVTTSVSPGLPPKNTIERVIPLLDDKNVRSVLDFGAGAFRHSIPLLEHGFEVCAVEFEETFRSGKCERKLREVREKYDKFSTLIWPRDFEDDTTIFDAALVCYVLQTMPVPKERAQVLSLLAEKLNLPGPVLYMSRYNQLNEKQRKNICSDGFFMWPKRERHSFYREFTTNETLDMFATHGFYRIHGTSLRERGTDQVYLFALEKLRAKALPTNSEKQNKKGDKPKKTRLTWA